MAAADDYESKYMGGGEALARSRVGWPWWFHAIMGTSGAFLIFSAIASSTLVPLLTLPLLAVVWLLLMFLRITVTSEHVHVQLGLFGPKIPIAKLVDAKAEEYQPLKYGGWGIRLGRDGSWAYSMPGAGRGVRLTYETESGKRKEVFVSTPDPEAILAGIAKARSGGGGVRVADETRVETAADPVAEAEAEGEAEADAQAKGEGRKADPVE